MKKTKRVLLLMLLLLGFGAYFLWNPSPKNHMPMLQIPPVEHNLQQRVETLLNSSSLRDDQLGLYIYDLTSDTLFLTRNEEQLMPPASCTKLLTAIATASRFGLDHTLTDSLFYIGEVQDSTLYGSLLFKADADPAFWEFRSLVDTLKQQGIKAIEGDLHLQLARRAPLRPHASWYQRDLPTNHLPLLFQGEQVVRASLRQELKRQGVRWNECSPLLPPVVPNGAEQRGESPARKLIAAEQHTVGEILAPMTLYSSNAYAQCIWAAFQQQQGWMTPSGNYLSDFIAREMHQPFYKFTLSDACGLSPENRLTARFLVDLLRWAYDHQPIYEFLVDQALPIAGGGKRTGSLHWRMERTPAVGKVLAKTGTLNRLGVSALAGYLTTARGHLLAFAILNRDLTVEQSRPFQDRLCVELCK